MKVKKIYIVNVFILCHLSLSVRCDQFPFLSTSFLITIFILAILFFVTVNYVSHNNLGVITNTYDHFTSLLCCERCKLIRLDLKYAIKMANYRQMRSCSKKSKKTRWY